MLDDEQKSRDSHQAAGNLDLDGSPIISQTSPEQALNKMKCRLKIWESRFAAKYGRKPQKEDVRKYPEVGNTLFVIRYNS